MKVILRLALKNLKEHKSKTAIISFLIILGVTLVILGNAFLETVNRGLEKDFRENYTGDIVIAPVGEDGVWYHVFGVEGSPWNGRIPQIAPMMYIDEVESVISETKGIKSFTKIISTRALLMEAGKEVNLMDLLDTDSMDLSNLSLAYLFAGDNATYTKTFDSIDYIEGSFPEEGSNDILIDKTLWDAYKKSYKKELHVGDKVTVLGANTDGIAREAVISGIFTPKNKNSAMAGYIFGSASFVRPFSDLIYASNVENIILDVDSDLSSMDEESLFGDFEFDFFDIEEDSTLLTSGLDIDYFSLLGDTSLRDELNKGDDTTWNLFLIKLKNSSDADTIIHQLNNKFTEMDIPAVAIDWKTAATTFTSSVEGVGIIFTIMVIILAVVVFLIVMNTMTVSVMERTGEIGTMRAIGSEKKFIQKLFFTESLLLTFVSSIIGAVCAFLITLILNNIGISFSNSMAKQMLGGGSVYFTITPLMVILTIIVTMACSLLSNVYPVTSALKVSPLKALSKGSE